ncbi:MAG: hypothetical protein E5Y58_02900 [Mesorhizobium sp.]|nr:MAG: hypothetical protein E5Y58_02900 [Mesorhizobium sp.]
MTIVKVGKVTPDHARDVAKDLLASVVKGQDPSRDRAEERGAVTFAKLADAFLHHVEALKKANTHAQYAHMLNAYGEALMTVLPMPKRAKTANPVAEPYEPTARELASQAAYAKRRENRRPIPQIKVSMSEDGGKRIASIAVDHPDPALGYELLAEAVGADSGTFLAGTLDSLAKAAQVGSVVREGEMNYALSMVCGLRPKDQIEATLGVQMAAIHLATMNTALCMGEAKTWELRESQERALNRLARTYVAQVEALKRYRSKGEQRVIVERVNVEKGGQAIVGNVAHGGGVGEEK